MATVWERSISEAERRALEPGAPEKLDPTPDVLVVGGGVIGLSTAAFCRRAGLGRVTVIERERLAAGPSGSALGGLSPALHALYRTDAFVRIGHRGLELHRALHDEHPGATALRSVDWLVPVPDQVPPELLGRAGARWVNAAEVREIEPQAANVEGAVFVPNQATVHPLKLAVALARDAGTVATGVTFESMQTRGDRVVGVRTSHGEISPGALVLATGSWEGIPSLSIKGHLFSTPPAPFRLRASVAVPSGVVQLEDGRLVAGGTFDLNDADPSVRPDVIEGIRDELGRVLPATRDLPVEHAWCCFRPGTPDELPVIDRLAGIENAYVNVGHFRTGLLVGPAAGEALASWISTGRRPEIVEAFSVARFGPS